MNSSAVMSVIIELIHYLSFFMLVGTIAIVDLRTLGVAGRRQAVAQLAELVFPWMWMGLGLTVLSGFIMFAGYATAYLPNSIFHIKLLVILLAIVFGVIMQWNVAKWDQSTSTPIVAKLVAFVSLVLWIGAILAGVAVPALTGLG
jgi:hypothetical protein